MTTQSELEKAAKEHALTSIILGEHCQRRVRNSFLAGAAWQSKQSEWHEYPKEKPQHYGWYWVTALDIHQKPYVRQAPWNDLSPWEDSAIIAFLNIQPAPAPYTDKQGKEKGKE